VAGRTVGIRNLADPTKVDSSDPDDPMAQLAVVLLALFGQMKRTYTIEGPRDARCRRDRQRPPHRPARPEAVSVPGLDRAGVDAPAGRGVPE